MKIKTRSIHLILAEKGLTKAALAEQCGIAPQNISTILGRGICEPVTAGKLARGLDVSVSEIVEEE